MRAVAGFLIMTGCAVWAQPFDAFEVATIKPTGPGVSGRWIRMQTAHQFQARNHALLTLVAAAYNLSPRAISGGPAWVESEHYDILAKAPGEVRPTLDEQMRMLRKLLEERFQLAFHRERKEMPVYALTVAKGGPKLKEATAAPGGPEGPPPLVFVLAPEGVTLPGRYVSMAEFASVFQRAALGELIEDFSDLVAGGGEAQPRSGILLTRPFVQGGLFFLGRFGGNGDRADRPQEVPGTVPVKDKFSYEIRKAG